MSSNQRIIFGRSLENQWIISDMTEIYSFLIEANQSSQDRGSGFVHSANRCLSQWIIFVTMEIESSLIQWMSWVNQAFDHDRDLFLSCSTKTFASVKWILSRIHNRDSIFSHWVSKCLRKWSISVMTKTGSSFFQWINWVSESFKSMKTQTRALFEWISVWVSESFCSQMRFNLLWISESDESVNLSVMIEISSSLVHQDSFLSCSLFDSVNHMSESWPRFTPLLFSVSMFESVNHLAMSMSQWISWVSGSFH